MQKTKVDILLPKLDKNKKKISGAAFTKTYDEI